MRRPIGRTEEAQVRTERSPNQCAGVVGLLRIGTLVDVSRDQRRAAEWCVRKEGTQRARTGGEKPGMDVRTSPFRGCS